MGGPGSGKYKHKRGAVRRARIYALTEQGAEFLLRTWEICWCGECVQDLLHGREVPGRPVEGRKEGTQDSLNAPPAGETEGGGE